MKTYMMDGYIRISMKNAKRRYDRGEVIYICPHKLRPGGPWHPECAIARDDYSDEDTQYFLAYTKEFEDVVREYAHYNCSYGTGKYLSYYIKEEK